MVKKKKQPRSKTTSRYRYATKKVAKIVRRKKKIGTSGTGPRLCGDDNEA